MIKGRQKGMQLETIVEKAFAPPPVETPPEQPGMPGPQAPAAGVVPASAPQVPPSQNAGGTPAAGQKPDKAQLLASLGGAA